MREGLGSWRGCSGYRRKRRATWRDVIRRGDLMRSAEDDRRVARNGRELLDERLIPSESASRKRNVSGGDHSRDARIVTLRLTIPRTMAGLARDARMAVKISSSSAVPPAFRSMIGNTAALARRASSSTATTSSAGLSAAHGARRSSAFFRYA